MCFLRDFLSVYVALVAMNRSANSGDSRDMGLILGSGRYAGGGHSNPLQYSCLGNPMDRGAWWATVHGFAKSQKWLCTHICEYTCNYIKKHDLFSLRETHNWGCLLSELEKEMATHSSILAWRIPWTEEPGGLQSTGSQSQIRLRDLTFSLDFSISYITRATMMWNKTKLQLETSTTTWNDKMDTIFLNGWCSLFLS